MRVISDGLTESSKSENKGNLAERAESDKYSFVVYESYYGKGLAEFGRVVQYGIDNEEISIDTKLAHHEMISQGYAKLVTNVLKLSFPKNEPSILGKLCDDGSSIIDRYVDIILNVYTDTYAMRSVYNIPNIKKRAELLGISSDEILLK